MCVSECLIRCPEGTMWVNHAFQSSLVDSSLWFAPWRGVRLCAHRPSLIMKCCPLFFPQVLAGSPGLEDALMDCLVALLTHICHEKTGDPHAPMRPTAGEAGGNGGRAVGGGVGGWAGKALLRGAARCVAHTAQLLPPQLWAPAWVQVG